MVAAPAAAIDPAVRPMADPVSVPDLLSAPPRVPAAEVLVVAAHPALEQSRINRRLLQAAHALATRRSTGTPGSTPSG